MIVFVEAILPNVNVPVVNPVPKLILPLVVVLYNDIVSPIALPVMVFPNNVFVIVVLPVILIELPVIVIGRELYPMFKAVVVDVEGAMFIVTPLIVVVLFGPPNLKLPTNVLQFPILIFPLVIPATPSVVLHPIHILPVVIVGDNNKLPVVNAEYSVTLTDGVTVFKNPIIF